jgi:hypothetical protein
VAHDPEPQIDEPAEEAAPNHQDDGGNARPTGSQALGGGLIFLSIGDARDTDRATAVVFSKYGSAMLA